MLKRPYRLLYILLTCLLVLAAGGSQGSPEQNPHRILIGPFLDVESVVLQCLGCHPQAGLDILQTSHWTWKRETVHRGKKTVFDKRKGLSTFAIVAEANPQQCMICHISTHFTSKEFSPVSSAGIDCLVCHDGTGTYRRKERGLLKGYELVRLAQQVTSPQTGNCLSCHGQKNKQGAARNHAFVEDDIHLQSLDVSFTCLTCHQTERHHIARNGMGLSLHTQRDMCIICHSDHPHTMAHLNEHYEFMACQTCHIPTYAQKISAMKSWSWVATVLENSQGFTFEKKIRPAYVWSDGYLFDYQRGDRIIPEQATVLRGPGTRTATAKIMPFAVTSATQLYDTRYRYLLSPFLSGAGEKSLLPRSKTEWEQAVDTGMRRIRLPFSGATTFTTTISYRPLNHGIAPAQEALSCLDCHGQSRSIFPWQSLGYQGDPFADLPAIRPLLPGTLQGNGAKSELHILRSF